MKKIILFLTIVAAVGCLQAQDELSTTPPTTRTRHFSVGVVGGFDRNYHSIDMAYMTDYSYDKYATGTTFGLQLAYHPWRWLALRADVVMIEKNYHRSHVFKYLPDPLPVTTTNDYLNVPVVLELSFGKNVRVNMFGGGYYGYWLKSHRVGKTYDFANNVVEFDEDVEFDEVRDNRVDMGFVYGAGLSAILLDRIELGCEVKWYYGVNDIQNPYMVHLRPRYNTTFAIQACLSYWL